VLSLATVGRHSWSYYLETVAGERRDRARLVEPDGVWLGAGALGLGLGGHAVDEARLGALLAGVDPVGGEVLDARHGRVRVLAYDCTFSAPKSVSVVHALAGPDVVEEIRRAHEASVEAALGFVEHDAGRVRDRRGGADRLEPTRGLSAAAFLHRTSRAPDPHLHTHVLVANLGCGPDGRWSAIDGRPLHVYASAAGALYRSQLRAELVRRLDVEWRMRPDGFADLAGVSAEVVTAFSRRRTAVLDELERTDRSGPRAARTAQARTRPDKDLDTPYEVLVASWRERAFDIGISAGRLRSVATRRPRPLGRDDRRGTPARVPLAEAGMQPFTVRDLVRLQADAALDGRDVRDVVAAVDAEVEAGLSSGALLVDTDQRAAAPTLRRRGGRIPTGVADTRLVSREYRALEEACAADLAAAPLLEDDGRVPGLYVVPVGPDPFGGASGLRTALALAGAHGRRVVTAAPGAHRAAHLEALTGVEVATKPELPPTLGGALVVVADPGCWDMTVLAEAIHAARAGDATVVVLGSTSTAGRTAISVAMRRDAPGSRGTGDRQAGHEAGHGVEGAGRETRLDAQLPCELAAALSSVRRHQGEAGATSVLVDDPRDLRAVLVRESAEQRGALGRAVVVVADRDIARAGGAGAGGAAATSGPGGADAPEWIAASSLPRLLGARDRGEGPVALVVLGSARLLPRSVLARTDVARVHVAVAPPGGDEAARRTFEEKLVSGRAISRAPRVREVPARARLVGGERSRVAPPALGRAPAGIGR
jgi:conjugative relaxase-like TrwC/TraI family protein